MTDLSNSKRPKIEENDTTVTAPTIRFRNYKAKDETLQASSSVIIPTDIPEDIKLIQELQTEKHIRIQENNRIIEEANSSNNSITTDLSTITIIPKRPNWDLKRDLTPKLAILDKRTQLAIHDILREKLTSASSASFSSSFDTTTGNHSIPISSSNVTSLHTTASTIESSSSSSSSLDAQYTGNIDPATLARLVTSSSTQNGHQETLDDDDEEEKGVDLSHATMVTRRRYADDDDD